MRIIVALFVSFSLVGTILHHDNEPGQPATTSLSKEPTTWCVIENENYAFWDKRFDRYASYWLERFSTEVSEEIQEENNLRIRQVSAWAHSNQYKRNTETAGSLTHQFHVFIYPYRINRPKVSKPKD